MVNVLFFASLRETLGVAQLDQPLDGMVTAGELLEQLKGRDAVWGKALDGQLLCSVNQDIVPLDTVVSDGDEVAFFPPVTGG
ncbi:molybdopterin synthase subunit MoaD [Amphritea atlantica]|uniref:Molybdopterin synthase sulfur carrier subunit n=1 Tax=Amphritea atlantica TaxID=355243 RepID=A0A1H9LSQ9_9GAMM|nr:MoaD/ThiS family protein [Amphritea atlantica]SER14542.1 molybdopterin synthase subunit MoaD [Amphritea atlantica]